MNNRVGVDESVEVNSNTTGSRTLYEHFRKRKFIWIISSIILIAVIIAVPTIIITGNNNEMEKASTVTEMLTTTEITTQITTSTTTTKSKQILPPVIINNNTKWKQNAVTVAGGNGQGSELNQLNWPVGIYVDDDDQSIYIVDSLNHRIVRWELDAKNGEIVAGGNERGKDIDQLDNPMDIILNKEKKYLIICDANNRRVMRWSRQNIDDQEILIPDIICWSLAIDNNGDLYIADMQSNLVRRFQQGDMVGIVVAGRHGTGNQLDQLDRPRSIFVDEYYSVYIADYFNNRVMKWLKYAAEGSIIAPGHASNENPNPLGSLISLTVDHMGNIYVSNWDNHQIMRWSPGAIEGTPVAGEKQSGSGSMQFMNPQDLSFDRQGNLYVVDKDNHRIQKFTIDLD
ncbi:unnamed protein product [Adineta steineri]|uniref:NHL repeat containing protein n=1 Tax=Adineta steineri TaxID=433720 RepID=A0A813TJP0_9BILA|nr:unnamed protein product [Adineta steineri]CAF4124858.1 unnamed protein product [Adineta steineri]